MISCGLADIPPRNSLHISYLSTTPRTLVCSDSVDFMYVPGRVPEGASVRVQWWILLTVVRFLRSLNGCSWFVSVITPDSVIGVARVLVLWPYSYVLSLTE